MSMDYKPMTRVERLYAYRQSQQLTMQSGAIGYLRGDFAKSGAEFHSQFFDLVESRKTDAFRADIDNVVNTMREPGRPLRDRYTMLTFCGLRESAGFDGNIGKEYGFRVDTAEFTYMLRCNPSPHDYNFYLWCYQRVSLESHMAMAAHGIRFITPHYQEKFRIEDGDQIRICYPDGEEVDKVCRYVDDYHLEVGNSLFHICEFAERLDVPGTYIIPLRSSLPEKCFSVEHEEPNPVLLRRGVLGYERTGIHSEAGQSKQEAADTLNDTMGVTRAQVAAMKTGSIYGWAIPGADPKNYDENGKPLRPDRNRDGR